MRTVDEILRAHDAGITRGGAELSSSIERFSRRRHIETVRRLSRVNGWKVTGFLVLHWSMIIASLATMGLIIHWETPIWSRCIVFLLGMIVIASRMQALGVMMHDAVHYMLYKNRAVNDVVADLFVSFPLGMSTTLYRKTHYRHHRFTNTEEDQDLAAQRQEHEWFEWPKTKWGCAVVIARSLVGLNFHKGWILFKHWAPWKHMFDKLDDDFPLRARFLYVSSLACVYGFFAWAILTNPVIAFTLMAMYGLAGMTILNLVNRIRATAEHLGVECTHELNSSRTIIPTLWERFLIAPYGVSYHLEHHLFPSVPGFNLPKLHCELMKDPEFAEKAHITHSYVGMIKELMRIDREGQGGEGPSDNPNEHSKVSLVEVSPA